MEVSESAIGEHVSHTRGRYLGTIFHLEHLQPRTVGDCSCVQHSGYASGVYGIPISLRPVVVMPAPPTVSCRRCGQPLAMVDRQMSLK